MATKNEDRLTNNDEDESLREEMSEAEMEDWMDEEEGDLSSLKVWNYFARMFPDFYASDAPIAYADEETKAEWAGNTLANMTSVYLA